jgi:hypothetical protein
MGTKSGPTADQQLTAFAPQFNGDHEGIAGDDE